MAIEGGFVETHRRTRLVSKALIGSMWLGRGHRKNPASGPCTLHACGFIRRQRWDLRGDWRCSGLDSAREHAVVLCIHCE